MMMVDGVLATLAWSIAGGALAEALRIVEAIRSSDSPRISELITSVAVALAAGLAIVWGWETPKPALELMVQGAAFPLLFTRMVAAASSSDGGDDTDAYTGHADEVDGSRRLVDYLAARF
jgi:hypothetical protein